MELVDSKPLPDGVSVEEDEGEDMPAEEQNDEPPPVPVHVDDPNGFNDKHSVIHGHDPHAKPRKGALKLSSAFSFSSKSRDGRGASSPTNVFDSEKASKAGPRPKKPAMLRFSSKKFVREITGRTRSQKERTRAEQEGSGCSVM